MTEEFLEEWNKAVQGIQPDSQPSHKATLYGKEIQVDRLSRQSLDKILIATSFTPSTFTGHITKDLGL